MAALPWSSVALLDRTHNLTGFSSGLTSVDDWFGGKALPEQTTGRVRTHVCLSPEDEIVAFFALKHINVNVENGSRAIRDTAEVGGVSTGLLLAQMGVHQKHQGNGVGKQVVGQVLRKASALHQDAAFRLLVVDAENSGLVPYYSKFGFKQLSGDLRMVMKMSAVNKAVAA